MEESVCLAEMAFEHGDIAKARVLLERFLQLSPQRDQFYCRMKILSGRIVYAENADKNGIVRINQCRRATAEILDAVDIARTQNNLPRYQFIIFNASVAFWNIVREYIRPGRGQYFASDFNKIIAALEYQDDSDKYWRIMMLSAASVCADDEKNVKNSTEYMDKAIFILESLLSVTIGEETQMTTVADACKAEVDAAMTAFRQIEDREELIRKPRKIDPDLPDDDEYYTKQIEYSPLQGLAAEGYEYVKNVLCIAQAKKSDIETRLRMVIDRKNAQMAYLVRLYRERFAIAPADSKKLLALPQVVKDLRLFCMIQLQSILCNAIPEKELDSTWQQCVKKLQDSPASDAKSETLLDFARVAWLLKQNELAKRCMELMQASTPNMTRNLRVKLDICEALQLIHSIDHNTREIAGKQLLSAKQIDGFKASKRLEAIKMLERTISTTASILEDKFVLYEMCTILWNMLIPFLSKKLRLKVHFALRTIANVLNDLATDALPLLRSQVHFELALAEEAADFAGIALTEAKRAYAQDYGGIAHPNPNDAVSPLDSDLLNINRVSDQYLTPFLKSLTLRIDVYASPSEAESQALLWLQQAKESTSKPLVKDMITKAIILIIEYIMNPTANKQEKQKEIHDNGPIDWSLVMMKMGKLIIPELALQELQAVFDQADYAVLQTEFSYSYQRVFSLLLNIVRLSFTVQDANILLHAFWRLMKVKFTVSDVFAYEFIDGQIEGCCNFAESMLWKLQELGKKNPLLLQESQNHPEEAGVFALGITAVVPAALITKNIHTSDINTCKKLAIQALSHALTLALSRKNVFHVHNVLIFFWNLHLHVFRRNLYALVIDEFYQFVKMVVSALETQLFAFDNIHACCDMRLLCNYIEALSALYASKNMMAEALDVLLKGVNMTFPGIASTSCTATYFKKSLAEKAATLTIQNAIAGVANGNDNNATKNKKNTAGAVPSMEPPLFPENPWLSCFSAITVAEFLFPPAFSETMVHVPKDTCVSALDKSVNILSQEVQGMVQKELEAEKSGTVIARTKETFNQRLELMLETYARLSRLRTIQGDFIGSQNFAEAAIHLFDSEQLRVYGRKIDPTSHQEDLKQLLSSRSFRWMACCELSMALAVVSFLDSAKGVSGVSTLDEALVLELQFSALNHLQPAIAYANWSREETLLQRGASIVAQIIPSLLQSDNSLYFRTSLDMVKHMLYEEMMIVPRHKPTQIMIRGVYLALVTGLIGRKCYDEALEVIIHAFDKLSNDLQKELWPGRVICMSKKGMNVLDGLQKLKENDPVLQAQVLVLFARSSKVLPSKLSGYQQAIELLDARVERVEYLAELAEVLAASGFTRPDIRAILVEGMSTLCTVEESLYEEILDWEEGDELPYDIGPATTTGMTDRGSTIRAASVYSKARSKLGSGTSKPIISGAAAASSVRGSTRGSTNNLNETSMDVNNRAASVAGSQVTRTQLKSGTSIARSSVMGGDKINRISGVPDELTLPKRLSFQCLELAARISIMRLKTDVHEEHEQLPNALQALYFLQRAMDTWLNALKDTYRCEQHAALDAETRATIPLTSFVCEEYPAFLTGWHLDSNLCEVLFTWNHDIAVRDYTWKQHARLNNNVDKVELPAKLAQDIPSLTSLPVFSASIYHLFALIDQFRALELPYHALYVIKVLRLLLWSFPILTTSTEDRNCALSSLQLLYQQVLLTLGSYEKQRIPVVHFPCEQFLISTSGEFVSLGGFLQEFLQKSFAKHVHEDISEKHKLDTFFQDLLSHTDNNNNEEKFNPFQIEVVNMTFESLSKIENDYFLLKTMRLLKEVGQWSLVEPLIVTFLWEKRYKRQVRYFCEALVLYLELLLMKGSAHEVVALSMASKPLLERVSDSRLLVLMWQVLVHGYLQLDQLDDAIQATQLLQHVLDDLTVRQLEKNEGEMATITSLLSNKRNDNSNNNDNNISATINRQIFSASSTVQNNNNNKNAKKPWNQKELGVDYLFLWKDNNLLMTHLLYLRAMKRLQAFRQAHNNALKGDILEEYQEFCRLLLTTLDVVKEYAGDKCHATLDILHRRVHYGQEFLCTLHKTNSRVLHREDYADWFKDNLSLVKEYAGQLVSVRRYWAAKLDLPESHLQVISTNNNVTTIASSGGYNSETGTFSFQPQSLAEETQWFQSLAQTHRVLPSLVQRHVAEALITLSYCDWLLAFHSNAHVSPTDFTVPPSVFNAPFNAVELFLQAMDNTLIDAKTCLEVTSLVAIACQAEQAFRLAVAFYPSRAIAAKLLQYMAQLAQYIANKAFDHSWQQHQCPNPEEADTTATHPVTDDTTRFVQQELHRLVVSQVDTDDVIVQSLVPYALLLLVESYGANGEAFQSATLLFQSQSVSAKDWLSQVYCQAVSRTGQVSIALQRVTHFHRVSQCYGSGGVSRDTPAPTQYVDYVNTETHPVTQVENRFLDTFASVCRRRLSVSQDVSHILSVTTQLQPLTVHIALQMCPLMNSVYLVAGFFGSRQEFEAAVQHSVQGGSQGSANANKNDKNKGKNDANSNLEHIKKPDASLWVIDKMSLTETKRRQLQVLQAQFQSWELEAQKFVALYGELLQEQDDCEFTNHMNHNSNSNKTTAQKAERALDETFRALSNDLNDIFEPLFSMKTHSKRQQNADNTEEKFEDKVSFESKFMQWWHKIPWDTSASLWQLQLYVDVQLQRLPWETLAVFEQCQVSAQGKLTRDFSLHMLGHRFQTLLQAVNPTLTLAGFATSTVPIPGLTDAINNSGFVGNIVPASSVKYFVDPFHEDTGNKAIHRVALRDTLAPASTSTSISNTTVGVGLNKWMPLQRNTRAVLSLEDFLLQLDTQGMNYNGHAIVNATAAANSKDKSANNNTNTNSVSILGVSLGRLGSVLSPTDLTTLNLDKVRLWINLDKSHNEMSFRRQNSADVLKHPRDVILEQETAAITALLSLAGVACLAVSQWCVPVMSQQKWWSKLCRDWTTPVSHHNTSATAVNNKAPPAATTSQKMKLPMVFSSHYLNNNNNSSTAAGGTLQQSQPVKMKKWIAVSRVVYGVSQMTYSDT